MTVRCPFAPKFDNPYYLMVDAYIKPIIKKLTSKMKQPPTKDAQRMRTLRAKRLEGLSAEEVDALRKEENQQRRMRRQRAKARLSADDDKLGLQETEAWRQADDQERKMLKTLVVKGNKAGLKEEALKRTLDDYRQRLRGEGKTEAEARVEDLEERDEKHDDQRMALKRRLKSAKWSRRRTLGGLVTA